MTTSPGADQGWRRVARRWSREPLVHFLIAGAALFVLMGWRGDAIDPGERTIRVNVADVERMAARFADTWQRQPTADEIDAMIREEIKDEVYAREAVRLGLAEGDPVIRRRLRTKMEYLARAEVDSVAPTDATLTAWIAKNPARYAEGATFDFDQIYVDATDAGRGRAAMRAAQAVLAGGGDWRTLGAPIALPQSMEGADAAAIDRAFGEGFAAALAKAKPGVWAGPVASGFGLHLIRVRKVVPGAVPRLDAVRQRVENDWRAETATAREARAYQILLDGYDVEIVRP